MLANLTKYYLYDIRFGIGRVISTRINGNGKNRASQLQLCASRGTGGVVTFGASTVLDIFDLEEDEESDEESESESFDD